MPAPNIQKMEPVVAALMTREQSLEALRQRELERHHRVIRELQEDYQRRLEDENTRHSHRLYDLQRVYQGERVPGICSTCGQDYNAFEHQAKEGKCPKCGSDLRGESEEVFGDTCGNCQQSWPCRCADPVLICGICAGDQYACRCSERSLSRDV